jgi:uncharacterized SAM-binding protein YcdF (DUF218 family)
MLPQPSGSVPTRSEPARPVRVRRLVSWVVCATAVVAVAIVVTSAWWLPLPGHWLDVSEPVQPADIIFMPSGQSMWRAQAAARLYHQRFAPRIVATAGGQSDLLLLVTGERIMDAEIIGRMFRNLDVPQDATTFISGVTSTREDVAVFKKYIESHGVRSAIVVTSHLHSRRLQWTMRRMLGATPLRLQFVEAEQPHFTAERWWQSEDGFVAVFNEYLKYGYYLTHY